MPTSRPETAEAVPNSAPAAQKEATHRASKQVSISSAHLASKSTGKKSAMSLSQTSSAKLHRTPLPNTKDTFEQTSELYITQTIDDDQVSSSSFGSNDSENEQFLYMTQPRPESEVEVFNEDDYDTDLDSDNDTEDDKESEGLAVKDYIAECNKLGTIPISYFQRHISDRSFRMRYHGLGPLGAKAISKPLDQNNVIETLDLEGNSIGADGAGHLCKVLKTNHTITHLNIAENHIGIEGVKVVCETMKTQFTIKQLDLSGNDLKDSSGEYIATMLSSNTTLRHLILRHNQLEFEGARWLRDALMDNEHLRILDLSWNNIRLKGAEFMAELVKENYGLKYLDLSMNGLGDAGAVAIGAALRVNQSLLELNLSSNRISKLGAVEVAKGLLVNDVLHTLRIGRNPLEDEGALAMLSAIGKNENTKLSLLDITDVIVKPEFEDLYTRINDQRNFYKLRVVHGGVYYKNKKLVELDEDPLTQFERDPMTKLKRYAQREKLRLVDLFKQFDKDSSWSLDRKEFIIGIKATGIDLLEEEIDQLIKSLDSDGNGIVDYGDLVFADQMHRVKRRGVVREAADKAIKDELKQRRKQEGYLFDDRDLQAPERFPRVEKGVNKTINNAT